MGKTNLSSFTLVHDFCRPYHQLNHHRDHLQQYSYRNIRSCESMEIILNHIHDEKKIISSRTSYNYSAYIIIKSSQIIYNGPIITDADYVESQPSVMRGMRNEIIGSHPNLMIIVIRKWCHWSKLCMTTIQPNCRLQRPQFLGCWSSSRIMTYKDAFGFEAANTNWIYTIMAD